MCIVTNTKRTRYKLKHINRVQLIHSVIVYNYIKYSDTSDQVLTSLNM